MNFSLAVHGSVAARHGFGGAISVAAPSAVAIAARSRTFGHITTTVPIAIIRPPAHSQNTSGVRNTSKVASPSVVDAGQHDVEVGERRRANRDPA